MSGSVRPLPLTVALGDGECATSYASRLAYRNGVPRLITFCSDVGIDYFGLANGADEEVRKLALLGGIDPDALSLGTPELIDAGWFRLGHERIKFTAFNRTVLRCCPRCIDEATDPAGPTQPGLWQLASIRTCEKHGCFLVPLDKTGNGNDIFDFLRAHHRRQPPTSDDVPAEDLALEVYLRDRVRGARSEGWLDSMDLHVAAQTCEGFGLLLTKGASARRDQLAPPDWAAAGAAGFRILRDEQDAMRAALKNIQLSQPIDNTFYRGRYKVFFEWLRYRDDDSGFDAIRDVMREFVFSNFPIATGQIVLGQPCPEQRVHSLSTAQTTFGMSRWILVRRLVELGLARSGTNSKIELDDYIPADVVAEIAAEMSGLLNATEAAHLLGVERMIIAKFASHGLIEKYFPNQTVAPLYRESELQRFLCTLRELAVVDPPPPFSTTIAAASKRTGIPITRLTDVIVQSRIKLYADHPSRANYRDLLVPRDDLSRILDRPSDHSVSPREAARTLNVNLITVRALVTTGLLVGRKITEHQTGRVRRYVCSNSLSRFRAQYVTVVELAAANGRLPGAEAIRQTRPRSRAAPTQQKVQSHLPTM